MLPRLPHPHLKGQYQHLGDQSEFNRLSPSQSRHCRAAPRQRAKGSGSFLRHLLLPGLLHSLKFITEPSPDAVPNHRRYRQKGSVGLNQAYSPLTCAVHSGSWSLETPAPSPLTDPDSIEVPALSVPRLCDRTPCLLVTAISPAPHGSSCLPNNHISLSEQEKYPVTPKPTAGPQEHTEGPTQIPY